MYEREVRFFDRRLFLRGAGAALVGLPVLSLSAAGCAKSPRALAGSTRDEKETAELSWRTVLTNAGEPGEPLVVSGRIFAADGKTPISGITLYVYHTDARGLYSEKDGQGGPPDPRIKGSMKTDKDGRYEFRTIRPASYPGTSNPQHIHAKVFGAGYTERTIPEYWFDDDPLITTATSARYAHLGTFSPVVSAKRGGDGVFACVRDIRLEKT
ncbi:MAG: protocatechuate 3,4-dioxygenase [Pyrinomonadaceae bacterium]